MVNRQKNEPTHIKQRVRQIVVLLSFVCALVFALGYIQAQLLGSMRALVYGEGIWAKSQRDSVLALERYLWQRDQRDWTVFETSLHGVMALRRSRLALEENPPDVAAAERGMLDAGHHPDDVKNLARLLTWGRGIPQIERAMGFWTEGDGGVDRLITLAEQIHKNQPSGDLIPISLEIEQLSKVLAAQETAFSMALGEGDRWLGQMLVRTNFLLLTGLLLMVGALTSRMMRDIDTAAAVLLDSQVRFKTLFDGDLIGIVSWDRHGALLSPNDAFLKMIGYDSNSVSPSDLNWRMLTPLEYKTLDERALMALKQNGYCDPLQKEFFHRLGHRVPVLVVLVPNAGDPEHGMAFILDRTSDKKMESQLQLSSSVLEASRDGILLCDPQRIVLTTNQAYAQMTQTDQQSLIGSVAQFCAEERADDLRQMDVGLATQGFWQGDTQIMQADGQLLAVRASLSVVRDTQGRLTHYVAVFTDISLRKALEQSLKNRAYYDPLTGLPNRSLFSDRLDTALARAQRAHSRFAVLFLDLDDFKPVNDRYGHRVGDLLLQQVAQRFKSVTRESDTIARLGGDEFVMISESLDHSESVLHVAEKLVGQLALPFFVEGHSLQVGCSIGISLFPDHGATNIELTRAADTAMYDAKASADGRCKIYDASAPRAEMKMR
ncbi:Conserved hypothetical protein [gamma proteobacterium HdN1]|nr:Conserved hypothetical protein [gamma proteobacterium HdN1]